jgi:DNA-binding SARP family transcriptional activator
MSSAAERRPIFHPSMIAARILGVVTLSVNGRHVKLGPKAALLAAMLLSNPARAVPADMLIRHIYEEELLAGQLQNPKATLQSLISDLRKILDQAHPGAGAILRTSGSAYIIQVEDEQVDVRRFKARLRKANGAKRENPVRLAELHRDALRQWPGTDIIQPDEPLAGIPGTWADGVRAELLTQQDRAVHQLLAIEIELGHLNETLPLLARLITLRPGDQPAVALHMLALYRAGRPTDAKAAYQRLYKHLRTEYGEMPDDALQRLNQQIIDQDPSLNLPVPKVQHPDETLCDPMDRSTPAPANAAPSSDGDPTPSPGPHLPTIHNTNTARDNAHVGQQNGVNLGSYTESSQGGAAG